MANRLLVESANGRHCNSASAPHPAALLYGALGFHFWNTRWREQDNQCIACPMQAWERIAIASALLIHAYGLYGALVHRSRHALFVQFRTVADDVACRPDLLAGKFHGTHGGHATLVLPLAAICTLLPVIFPQVHLVANASATGFKLHFLAAMLAYSLLTLSALHAIFMGFSENALHKRQMKRSLASLPPFLTMESLLFRMLLLGFILLTLTVGSGVLFSEALFGKPLLARSQDAVCLCFVGHFRDPAGRAPRLGLARKAGTALDACRVLAAHSRLRGQPLRRRSHTWTL